MSCWSLWCIVSWPLNFNNSSFINKGSHCIRKFLESWHTMTIPDADVSYNFCLLTGQYNKVITKKFEVYFHDSILLHSFCYTTYENSKFLFCPFNRWRLQLRQSKACWVLFTTQERKLVEAKQPLSNLVAGTVVYDPQNWPITAHILTERYNN